MKTFMKSISGIFVLALMLYTCNSAIAIDNYENVQYDDISEDIIESLQNTIKKETEKTLNSNGLYYTCKNNKAKSLNVLEDDNGNMHYLVKEIDNTNNKELIKQSYKEPVKIYSAIYENSVGINGQVNKTIADSYIYNASQSISYSFTIYADKTTGGYVNGAPTSRYKLTHFDFSWSNSGGSCDNGIYRIDYNIMQKSCADKKEHKITATHGWPSHHTYGITTKYSGFTTYANITDTTSPVGFCGATIYGDLYFDGGNVCKNLYLPLLWGNWYS